MSLLFQHFFLKKKVFLEYIFFFFFFEEMKNLSFFEFERYFVSLHVKMSIWKKGSQDYLFLVRFPALVVIFLLKKV